MIKLENRDEWINENLIISVYDFNTDKCKIHMINGDSYYSDETAKTFCGRLESKCRSIQIANEQLKNKIAKEYGR